LNIESTTSGSAARTVAANALSPFAAQLVTKVLMLGYGIVQYRLLGGGERALGDYFVAGYVLLYTSTISDWGLSTLLTREVAKSRGAEGEAQTVATLFRQTLSLRLLISLALFLPVGVFVALYGLSADGAWATVILTLSLLPNAFSGAVTALLYAYERMSLPAAIGVGTSVLNVALGFGALLAGWGIAGLALAALVATLATAAVFWMILERFASSKLQVQSSKLLNGTLNFELATLHWLRAGWPLMLNALLVGLFFRVDQFIIRPNVGVLGVERYQAAYSFLNFVLLITPAVTLALFPRMARHAVTDRLRLAYEYAFVLKLLLVLSVPIVILTIWFAPVFIAVLTGGKQQFLPESAIALQILILFLPFSFVNGVTQYVLIALDLQKLITRAFAATVVFNVAANLLLVPLLGIYGAALATVLSELVLLGPFLLWTRREIGSIPLAPMALKPLVAGAAMGVAVWGMQSLVERWSNSWADFALYATGGMLLFTAYTGVLWALRPFTDTEANVLLGLVRKR
jgi:O-antigen/teichoic acid export membrane protein